MYYAISAVISLILGIFFGYWVRKQKALSEANSLETRAEKILTEAKTKEKQLLLDAQERSLKIIDESKREIDLQKKELTKTKEKLEQRENLFSQKLIELQEKQQGLYDKLTKIEEAKDKIKQIKQDQLDKLEKIAQMSKEDAQNILFKNIEKESQEALMSRINKLNREGEEVIEVRTRELIGTAMQRLASDMTAELSTTVVDIPSDEMKGRIIGREGRNIKTIENLTGVEIIVDDIPNVITVSGFSGIRRHVAKRALEILIKDGRIHPTKIEAAVEQAKKDLAVDIKKAGEEALYELGLTGFDPKLIQIIGRMKYRTSYGQNALKHSVEVAHLCGLLAEELGANVAQARKAGLLHDIGKAVDHEIKGSHPEIGGQIARKFNLPEEIIDAIENHHDDNPKFLTTIIVKAADAISSSRPGARNDSFDKYIQRLEELEKVAESFEGVNKTYAIQAGREIRVFVDAEKITDVECYELAKKIAKKIEEELKYPGEIKVNLLRETRVIEYAR
ncbi:MAG: ribonuclease Y [Candidatus Falkowbacteria bacterium]